MTNEAKPTPGPYTTAQHGDWLFVSGADWEDFAQFPVRMSHHSVNDPEGEANAALYLDALNVHHDTGLTPRQLAEQRAGLLEALQAARKYVVVSDHPASGSDLKKIEIALAKARGGAA